jgi:hypothetical protein
MKRLLIAALVCFVLYITSYILLRSLWTHRTADNLRNEMIFPTSAGWLHVLYSPLCMLDEKMSGMSFRIGPHPEPAPQS